MASQQIVSLKKQSKSCISKVKLLSPAKINLYLNILGKYPTGFHKIESIAERISLFDKIIVKCAKHNDVKIFCNKKELENSNNLCVKAAKLLKEKYNIGHGFDIFLTKNIPIGSGLGGGSSNAAFTILAINKVCHLNLNQKTLYKIGSYIGSDVNFFLAQSSFAIIHGRGEKVLPIQGKSLYHTIIWPGVGLATKDVYGAYKAKLTNFLNNAKIICFAINKGDLALIQDNIFNALEQPALSLCKELSAVRTKLLSNHIFARVTGSGSALYTVSRKPVYKRVKQLLPKKWFVYEAQTF